MKRQRCICIDVLKCRCGQEMCCYSKSFVRSRCPTSRVSQVVKTKTDRELEMVALNSKGIHAALCPIRGKRSVGVMPLALP